MEKPRRKRDSSAKTAKPIHPEREKWIPSEEDFARASAAMKQRMRGLSEVKDRIKSQFEDSGVLDELFISSQSETSFTAIVFLNKDDDIAEAEQSGLTAKIKDAVYGELGKVGRGDRNAIEVAFEFDSYENVRRNYGNYYNRIR